MKQKILLLFLLAGMFYTTVKANETEPNNTKAQANTLALNGSNTGAIGTATDVDWWKVTTTSDGKLNITITVSNNKYLWCTIYDNDGTTVLNSNYTSGTTTVSQDGLAAGTYFVKLYPYSAGDLPAYTVSNTLTVPAQANDIEPNGSKATALTLSLNGSITGHVGYYYNNLRDSVDWYKVTTTADGRLRLSLNSGNGQYIWAHLYDNDGTTELRANYTSGNAVVIDKDGLAAGTYYIKVNAYDLNGFIPYTLSDSLFKPTETNDVEPDSIKAQAITLPLNGSKQGHVNYYYNNHTDSVDWYKVTTTGDGRLRLTLKSGNGQYIWAHLLDNDGTTQLAASYTSGNAVVVDKDGLAAGTYYIKVNAYDLTGFVPYTISDSLFKPTQANDSEPNNNKTTALTLPVNGSLTGHVNYYYNLKRDSADWYKLTTTQDGMITIGIQSNDGQYVWAYLFDNDGTTVLAQSYTSSSTSYSFDGLKAGTYYIKVSPYDPANGFMPYTLSNTVTAYTNANDKEPNDYFKTAKTLPSNGKGTGHVNFYYNGSSDAVDYHKINYTGASGNLTLLFQQQNRLKYGSVDYTWFQVYKDTASAPIFSNYFTSTSGNINLTGLTQGYYYIKVYTYSNGAGEHFSSYSIKNTYTQVNKATIQVVSYSANAVCDSLNSISYQLAKSHAPYRVQLYRFGTAYGSPVTVSGTTILFNDLPSGSYYATVFGDGATGNAFSQSAIVTLMPKPQNLTTTAIQATKATLNWNAVSCADYFSIQYKKHSITTWTTVPTTGNVSNYVLNGLTANTKYDWRIASVDTGNAITAISAYADSVIFTTPASFAVNETTNVNDLSANKLSDKALLIYPNPARNVFTIRYTETSKENVSATLFDMTGKAVWTSGAINAASLNGKQVVVNQLDNGLYYLKIANSEGVLRASAKVAINR